MHIERILLRDVGPFDDVTIELPKGSDPRAADVYLLTGPNGAGKTTVLYALAAVIAGGQELLGVDQLAPRMRSAQALVAFEADSRECFSTAPRDAGGDAGAESRGPFGGPPLHETRSTAELSHYSPGSELSRYSYRAANFLPDNPMGKQKAFHWAAFAYAGIRSMSDVHISAVQEPKISPFQNSLSFLQTTDTDLLANWIVSQNYRRLKAKEAGDLEDAEAFEQSVRRIERIIADIVEDPGFAFAITAKDDDVRVRWRGVTVRLGVLPDGLQSIVSWVADLLMRLDRIPWQDHTPIEQRRFLLLLDEIDIHLHPAWQRRVLPLVQRLFPNAQILASTQSPLVVGSLADGRIISLGLEGSSAHVVQEEAPRLGTSYRAVLRSVFGVASEFDLDTERKLDDLNTARRRLLAGDQGARADVERLAEELRQRSDELRALIALELQQPPRER
jgi:hypothetical protein